ncbi:MAG: hypothetical protein OER90_20545, partial [Gemmatimonadota bacterium]|nr:hypothetical protein [Gemmatimonadota bacterium]
MNPYLLVGAIIAAAAGILHSWLGERFILRRLFRRQDLPHLFGSDVFTKRTLRMGWHLTSIAWWGFAGMILLFALQPRLELSAWDAVAIIRWTFLVSAVYAFV